jgi:hypothetical protein
MFTIWDIKHVTQFNNAVAFVVFCKQSDRASSTRVRLCSTNATNEDVIYLVVVNENSAIVENVGGRASIREAINM